MATRSVAKVKNLVADELVPVKGQRTPRKYLPEYDTQAYKLCLLGASNEKLADFFGVTLNTIKNWLTRHPSFGAAFRNGKDVADAEIANSLFNKARGYTHRVTKVVVVKGVASHETFDENVAPDANAASFWLRNRQPALWREKTEVDNTIKVVLTEEQVNAKIAQLQQKALATC